MRHRNESALRRRLRLLAAEGLVRIGTPGFRQALGRPQGLASLCEKGVALLKDKGMIQADVPVDRVTVNKIRCLEHHLLINEFRVQLTQVPQVAPHLSVHFLASTSLGMLAASVDRPFVHERFRPRPDSDQWLEFTPDGVFVISRTQPDKAVLFFLEVDMGTETVASPQPCSADLRQKVVAYKAFLRRGLYKRYEQVWDRRLAELACSLGRLVKQHVSHDDRLREPVVNGGQLLLKGWRMQTSDLN